MVLRSTPRANCTTCSCANIKLHSWMNANFTMRQCRLLICMQAVPVRHSTISQNQMTDIVCCIAHNTTLYCTNCTCNRHCRCTQGGGGASWESSRCPHLCRISFSCYFSGRSSPTSGGQHEWNALTFDTFRASSPAACSNACTTLCLILLLVLLTLLPLDLKIFLFCSSQCSIYTYRLLVL